MTEEIANADDQDFITIYIYICIKHLKSKCKKLHSIQYDWLYLTIQPTSVMQVSSPDINIAQLRNNLWHTSMDSVQSLLSSVWIVLQNMPLYLLCAKKQDYMNTVLRQRRRFLTNPANIGKKRRISQIHDSQHPGPCEMSAQQRCWQRVLFYQSKKFV